ncbi:hypothetical protein L207DRAFT_508448 [Hyaloscypha variabilis F]|uniref:Uncharacterized protein n=1 Tax=Hyaloscypha variabilis (strain UAMH 11265 / GT02V1 / F) TaxID=1149755 RepID=A0A2J6S4G4_HYAVF|nr:hypothetical protein L207DRAFT_508448 [Hyaloscypha variabilis F]
MQSRNGKSSNNTLFPIFTESRRKAPSLPWANGLSQQNPVIGRYVLWLFVGPIAMLARNHSHKRNGMFL